MIIKNIYLLSYVTHYCMVNYTDLFMRPNYFFKQAYYDTALYINNMLKINEIDQANILMTILH